MKKLLLIAVICLFSIVSTAQISNQLIAVHQFANLTAINAIANPIRGNLAYNLDNGFLYFYNGISWVQTPSNSSSSSGWELDGNNVSSSDFIGTTNNQNFKIRVNNNEVLQIRNKGAIINTQSIYIGSQNGENETGLYTRDNIGIGSSALEKVTSGSGNVALGLLSAGNLTTAYHNVAVGVNALTTSLGIQNTAVGARAYYTGNYSNSTAIGNNSIISANNQVRIGGSAVTSIGGPVAWSNLSDMRFKENIKDNVPGLDFIMELKPVTYNVNLKALDHHLTQGKKDSIYSDQEKVKLDQQYRKLYQKVQIGFLAQEVEALADSLNFDFHAIDKPQNEESTYALRYAEFVAPIVKAMQEQQELINQQKSTIETLVKRLDKLEKIIDK